MAEFDVKIKAESPLHLGSGQADVNIDAEIVHDAYGLPYFPAKRFKGLLYESAVEVFEMFELAGISTANLPEPKNIFHRESVSEVQIIVPNFYICPFEEYEKLCAEWQFLQINYKEIFRPADVLKTFTSIRYQIQLKNGVDMKGSLRNLNVLEAGVEFFGRLEILNPTDEVLNLIALAIRNLQFAGTKRNRGFGYISCEIDLGKNFSVEEILRGREYVPA